MHSLRGQNLLIATGNEGKLAEFAALLVPYGTRVLSLRDVGLDEPEETEFSFAGNARLKAQAASQASGLVALADDSGLVVEGLGGLPGIYTADWAERRAGRNFAHAMQMVVSLLRAGGAPPPWKACFVCSLVLFRPQTPYLVFEGRIAGQIVWPMRGSLGHGFDPIFLPDGFGLTLGEMPKAQKNLISHRADAVRQFIAACFT